MILLIKRLLQPDKRQSNNTVMVPKSVAEVLENAMSQRELADLYMEKKEEQYEEGLGKLL